MKWKTILGVAVVVFAAGALVYTVARRTADGEAAETLPEDAVVVTYFHGPIRCPTCNEIERLAFETFETSFPEALADGRLLWRAVNREAPGRTHYTERYRLVTQSVVVSERRDGKEVRWKNLDKIWAYVGDPALFRPYVREEVAAYVDEET